MIYTIEEARRIIGVHNRLHGGNARERKQAKRLGMDDHAHDDHDHAHVSTQEVKQDLRDIEKLLETQ